MSRIHRLLPSMNRIFFVAVSFILALNSEYARASSFDKRIGVVEAKGNLVCLIISEQNLKVGSKVSLVFPTNPQKLVSSVVTTIGEKECAGASKSDIPGRFYQLSLRYNPTQLDWPAIGILDASSLRRAGSKVVGDLDNDEIKESFRSCASHEGLHLTVWSGQQITGTRRWHRYYYLGYDTEPTCTKLEVNSDGGA